MQLSGRYGARRAEPWLDAGSERVGFVRMPAQAAASAEIRARVAELEAELARGDVGAVLIEAVPGAGGVIVPAAEYMRELGTAVRAHGALLVADESATGFGRTGLPFAFQHFGLAPDLVILAKAVTAGYLPMGVLLLSHEVAQAAAHAEIHGPSQGGNPAACAAGLASLEGMQQERPWLNAAVQGERLRRGMASIGDVPFVVRGLGLLVGVEFSSAIAERVRDEMRRRGALVYARERFLGIFPPLDIPEAVTNEIVEIFGGACADVARRAGRACAAGQ
jgi:adenosylmethionine-8-amino-7-oxononanoate aminotransferase